MFSIIPAINNIFHCKGKNEEASVLGSMSTEDGKTISLKAIHVRGSLEGLLFSWNLEQEYINETKDALEIIYTFPLAYKSVLLGMKASIGERELDGVVVAKKEAEEQYEEAVSSGDSAIMVQQTGGGLFTANLGNIKPGEKVKISMQCAQMQTFEGNRIRIALPLLTGERYGDPHQSGVLAAHESAVTSAAASYGFDAEIIIKGEMAQGKIECPGWDVIISEEEGEKKIRLAKPGLANKDFIILLSDLPARSSAIETRDGEDVMLCASFSPVIPVNENTPLALKILVDCSGSMGGSRIEEAQKGLSRVLGLLHEKDQVSYSRFGSNVIHETKGLNRCDKDYINKLSGLVDRLYADLGGTEMENALLSTFKLSGESELGNSLLLITDGDVWNIDNIINTAKKSGHQLFIIGVGSAPGENLLERMAEESGGACEMVSAEENIAAAIERMFRRMRNSRVANLRIEWGATPIWASRFPKSIFSGDTVTMYALFSEAPKKAPVLCWQSETGDSRAQASELVHSENYDFVRLGRKAQLEETKKNKEKLKLALAYQLVTDQTSLILVMDREEDGKIKGLPKIQNVPQMRAVDNFMPAGSAFACFSMAPNLNIMKFRDHEIPAFLRMAADDASDVIDYDVTDHKDILAHACDLFKRELDKGKDFKEIYNIFQNDEDFIEVWKFLNDIKGNLGLKQLFAIFLIWAMQTNDLEIDRHSMRPIRFEIHDVDKAGLDRIEALLDDWLNG